MYTAQQFHGSMKETYQEYLHLKFISAFENSILAKKKLKKLKKKISLRVES